MTQGYTYVPSSLWHDIRGFFAVIVAPCKDCVRGNPVRCWHSECAAFRFRELARRVEGVHGSVQVRVPRHVLIENEVLAILRHYGEPVYPSMIVLTTTHSKANKRNAINRLVRKGLVVEQRVNSYTRLLSLPQKKEPEK